MTRLSDLKAGDEVVRCAYLDDKAVLERLVVKRVSKQTLTTTDGVRWRLDTGLMNGDPGRGYATTIEPFNPDVHPYSEDIKEVTALLRGLRDTVQDTREWRALAEQLPLLREIAVAVKGKAGT